MTTSRASKSRSFAPEREAAQGIARNAVAQVAKTRRLRLKPKRSNGFNTPAGMRSVCPKIFRALAHEMGGPCPPLPQPCKHGRGPLGGPDQEQEQEQRQGQSNRAGAGSAGAGSGAGAAGDMGKGRTAQASTSPVQPRLDCGARFATAQPARPSFRDLDCGVRSARRALPFSPARASAAGRGSAARPSLSPDQGVPSAARPCPCRRAALAASGGVRSMR